MTDEERNIWRCAYAAAFVKVFPDTSDDAVSEVVYFANQAVRKLRLARKTAAHIGRALPEELHTND